MTTSQEQIEKLVLAHPSGLALNEIIGLLREQGSTPIAERTLRRRLGELTAQGAIRRIGARRATRYLPPDGSTSPALAHGIELTPEAEAVRRQVSLPISHRSPVGYNEQFLRQYDPGRTWYLEASLREHLLQVG